MMIARRGLFGLGVGAMLGPLSGTARAQAWPARPVRQGFTFVTPGNQASLMAGAGKAAVAEVRAV